MSSRSFQCAGCGEPVTKKNLGDLLAKLCVVCKSKEGSEQLQERIKQQRKDQKAKATKKQPEKPSSKKRVHHAKADLKLAREQLAAQKEIAERELASRHLLPFIQRFKEDYKVGWVHKVFAAKLEKFYEDVKAGKQPRLMIFVPPRHGKSEIVSNNFPSWILGKEPHWEVIMASHTIGLPIRFSKANRARIDSDEYRAVFSNTSLDKTSTSAEEWMTTKRGGLKCAGVGSAISGFGANVFIIDDPIKDFADAQSQTIRETVKSWYTTTAESRLAPQGGMIVVQCMVGDTAVLMADGKEKKLDQVRPGDTVATYDNGELTHEKVLNWCSQGYDSVYRITTASGKMVEANERHPFLVDRRGERIWVRLRNLQWGDSLIRLQEGPGQEKSAAQKDVPNWQNAGACATAITTSGSGQADTALHRQRKTRLPGLALNSSIDTVSRLTTITLSLISRVADALFVAPRLKKRRTRAIGGLFSALTTAMRLGPSADSCATAVICSPHAPIAPRFSKKLPNTFDKDRIIRIEHVGQKEVFDLQVERTENFIANGVVSHNTRWHDDDLSGWQLRQDKENREDGVDEAYLQNWEVVSFPAIAESDEYIDKKTLDFFDEPADDGSRILVRREGQALHPARYSKNFLLRKKANMPDVEWGALYQQNPVPASGEFFRDEDFMYYSEPPLFHQYPIYFAWDLAIGEKRRNDYTVGVAGLLVPRGRVNHLYVLDMYRNRVRDKAQIEAMVNMYMRYKANAAELGVEYGQIWLAIEQRLRAAFEDENAAPSFNEKLKPITQKRVRATPLQGWMNNHRVWFPKNQPWALKAKEELLRFDSGVHDDIVDALAWLVRMVQDRPLIEKFAPKDQGKTVSQRIEDYYRDQQMGDNLGFMVR